MPTYLLSCCIKRICIRWTLYYILHECLSGTFGLFLDLLLLRIIVALVQTIPGPVVGV